MSQLTQKQNVSPKVIAGFWIRVFADVIDFAILWAFAFVLSFVMESWFVKLGENGVWFGLLVSIAYFVPMQSRFGNGQSLGKRVLGIQVLDLNGMPLSLMRSFSRYLIIAFVGYSSVFTGIVNLTVSSSLSTVANSLLGTLWFIALVGCYLLVPLHPLKRGLHDLLVGSVVVYRNQFNAAALAALNNPAKTQRAFAIVGVISAVVIAVGIWGLKVIMKDGVIADFQKIQSKLEATGRFHTTSINNFTFSTKSGTTRSMLVQTHIARPLNASRKDLKSEYDLVFQAIRDQIKDVSKYDNLRVGLRLGYNFGIRRRYITMFLDEDPNNPGERKEAGANNDF